MAPPPAKYVLNPDEAKVLSSATRSGEFTPYDLAAATRLAPSTVQGVIGKLARKGLVVGGELGFRLTQDGQECQWLLTKGMYGQVHVVDKNDPQKGKWGLSPEANNRRVTGTVMQDPADEDWYDVRIEVTSTDPNNPLSGEVEFFLHPTFARDHEVVQVKDGKAVLEFSAWGAFTVGVRADNGETQLELDLAELPGAPEAFREQ